jgi:hypothetical protein
MDDRVKGFADGRVVEVGPDFSNFLGKDVFGEFLPCVGDFPVGEWLRWSTVTCFVKKFPGLGVDSEGNGNSESFVVVVSRKVDWCEVVGR